jgi:hypothetical protein
MKLEQTGGEEGMRGMIGKKEAKQELNKVSTSTLRKLVKTLQKRINGLEFPCPICLEYVCDLCPINHGLCNEYSRMKATLTNYIYKSIDWVEDILRERGVEKRQQKK